MNRILDIQLTTICSLVKLQLIEGTNGPSRKLAFAIRSCVCWIGKGQSVATVQSQHITVNYYCQWPCGHAEQCRAWRHVGGQNGLHACTHKHHKMMLQLRPIEMRRQLEKKFNTAKASHLIRLLNWKVFDKKKVRALYTVCSGQFEQSNFGGLFGSAASTSFQTSQSVK